VLLTKHQTSKWEISNEPRPKKILKIQSKIKVLLTVFIDYKGLVHHEFLQSSQTAKRYAPLAWIYSQEEAQVMEELKVFASWQCTAASSIVIHQFLAENLINNIP